MKVLKNNYNSEEITKEIKPKVLTINCDRCDSELEITENDTHIGWLGARFITCPCCGEESMIDELEGITLTKDNLKFPVHFSRTTKGLRHIIEIKSEEIIREIKIAIAYFRENKDQWNWFTSYGDLFLSVYRYDDDKEYMVVVTKDFYETNIPFEREDYE